MILIPVRGSLRNGRPVAAHARRVKQAMLFAAAKHAGQFRADGVTPYIRHPEKVVETLRRHGYTSPALLSAAALHDTIEDAGVAEKELRQRFGDEVAAIVQHVSHDPALAGDAKHAAMLARIVTAPAEAQALKLADRICNVYDAIHSRPSSWSDDKFRRYMEGGRAMAEQLAKAHPSLAAELLKLVSEGLQSKKSS